MVELFQKMPINQANYETKLPYSLFQEWYIENPAATPKEISELFNVSLRCAYAKLRIFNKRHPLETEDINLSSFVRDSFEKGYDKGVIVGISLGYLGCKALDAAGLDPLEALKRLISENTGAKT